MPRGPDPEDDRLRPHEQVQQEQHAGGQEPPVMIMIISKHTHTT